MKVVIFVASLIGMFILGCSDNPPQPQNYAKIVNYGVDCNSTIEIGFKPPAGEGTSFSIMDSLK